MKLRANLPVKGNRIDYSLDTVTGEHEIVFAMSGARVTASNAGGIYNALAPYRGNREVDELLIWLFK